MRFYSITALFMATIAIAAPANEVKECCCCNINEPAIVCTQRAPKDCICPAVMCPEDAPTRWPDSPVPTATTTTAVVEKRQAEETPKSEPCCCCNPGRGAIVCTIRDPEEDQTCMCPMVLCPSDAPTLTEGPGVVASETTGN